jgi:hypothetical protein
VLDLAIDLEVVPIASVAAICRAVGEGIGTLSEVVREDTTDRVPKQAAAVVRLAWGLVAEAEAAAVVAADGADNYGSATGMAIGAGQ